LRRASRRAASVELDKAYPDGLRIKRAEVGAVRGDVARLEARSQRIERELERVTWALDRVGTELQRLGRDDPSDEPTLS
jgi:hypothetical protein